MIVVKTGEERFYFSEAHMTDGSTILLSMCEPVNKQKMCRIHFQLFKLAFFSFAYFNK